MRELEEGAPRAGHGPLGPWTCGPMAWRHWPLGAWSMDPWLWAMGLWSQRPRILYMGIAFIAMYYAHWWLFLFHYRGMAFLVCHR